ncbi:hypothetical protein LXJ15735_40810 [Lacrimispora xylanolytica]|uniref:DUF1697 domain-containing protein n=1 Tax=Clostridium sp. 12(A) TaxID=1163671 RepID=UPI0004B8C56F|nr:DUF1697 domain-containing protein [Clostridium sp. 12(A)]
MGNYIALLRGINVGGKNKIAMPELKKMFEEMGYQNVVTYINSGNIVFSSNIDMEEAIKKNCELAIKNYFNLAITVTIISEKDLSDALSHAPTWWDQDAQSKHNAIFVIPPATAEEVIDMVGHSKPEYEQVSFYGQVIFWSAPIQTFSRTRWSKIVGKSAYQSVTIRNANTTKRLLQLLEPLRLNN